VSDGLKVAGTIAFVGVVLALAFMVFRARSTSQRLAVARGVSPPVLPTSWDTGDVADTTEALGAHH